MISAFFTKAKNSKVNPGIGTWILLAFPLTAIVLGHIKEGLVGLAIIGSIGLGIQLFAFLGDRIGRYSFQLPQRQRRRVTNGFAAFGFLFLPSFVCYLCNMYFDAGIEMYSLPAHTLWAFIGGFLGYFFSQFEAEEDSPDAI